MARKRKSSSGIKPTRFWTGFWYVVTLSSTALLTALLIGIVINSDSIPKWQIYLLVADIVVIIFLIATRKFTTSETIAWGNRRR